MKFVLKNETFYKTVRAWVVEVNFNDYPDKHPNALWWTTFTNEMDSKFITPFDFRRLCGWRKRKGKARTWFVYVTLPENFKGLN